MRILIFAIFAILLISAANWPSFGVVYVTKSKIIRRIILPDYNSQLYETMPLETDESMLIVLNIPFGDAQRCARQIDISACRRLVDDAQ